MAAGAPVVLVVDDEDVIRRGCATIVAAAGCRVMEAANAAEAMAAVEAGRVDVVLLDLMLPDADAGDTLERIRVVAPDARVVVLSGYATAENAVRAIRRGAFDFLAKPFLPDELRSVVRRALSDSERKTFVESAAAASLCVADSQVLDAGRTVLEAVPFGLVIVDPGLCVAYANREALRHLGCESADVTRRGVLDLLPGGAAEEAIRGALDGRADAEFDLTLRGDEPRILAAKVRPIRSAASVPAGAAVVFEDVTLRHKVERARTEFVGTVVHELRAPLSTVQQLVYFLRDGEAGSVTDVQRDLLTRVQVRIAELLELVKNLLNLAKLEAGTLVYRHEPVPLAPLIRECVETFATAADAKRIAITIEVADDLIEVMGDRENLKTAVRNLIGNAVKYTGEGGAVTVTANRSGDAVEVAVRDTGIGIPKEALAHVFDKFFRVDDERTRWITGSGLGLALTRQIVEKQGGWITVESEVDVGSTFRVWLKPAI